MTIIETTSGLLSVEVIDGLIYGRGIPYATADRFRDPVPVDTPDVERDATRRGPACVQNPSRLLGVNGPIVEKLEQSEHCQVLSVTAPSDARGLPVMVWFHGGAYVSGGGEAPKYDPDPLVREGVVVVTVTYRLGGFGYLIPTGSGDTNAGLKDQLEALRWVSANIGVFGGNPHNVTLFGQSAGGDSVLSLIASEGALGLFQRAIVQSAPLGIDRNRNGFHERVQGAFTGHFTGNPATASAAEMLSAEKTVDAAAQGGGPAGGMPFSPLRGHAPMSVNFDAALTEAAPDVELLIGNTKNDAAPFVAMDPRVVRLRAFGFLGRLLASRIEKRVTRELFGIDSMVALWRDAGGRVATYRFDWAPDKGPFGACHCLELPFLFGGDWTDAPMLAGQMPPEPLATSMRRAWAGFARDGIDGLKTDALVFSF